MRIRGRDDKIILRLIERPVVDNSEGDIRGDRDSHLHTRADKVVSTSHHRRIEQSHGSHTLQCWGGRVGRSKDHDDEQDDAVNYDYELEVIVQDDKEVAI